MNSEAWHIAEPLLIRFALEPQRLDDVTAASVEAHLVECSKCREVTAGAVDSALTDASWAAIAARVDRPRATVFERAADIAGLPSANARLVSLTPAFQLANLAAVLVLAGLAVFAARAAHSPAPFLFVAPIVPLVTVGLLGMSVSDPAGEIGVATAMHGLALLVRRSLATSVFAFGVLAFGSLALGNLGVGALVWLLPGLALSTGSVLLSSWVRPEIAVISLVGMWIALFGGCAIVERFRVPASKWPLFGGTAMITCALVSVVCAVLVVARRDRFATLEYYR